MNVAASPITKPLSQLYPLPGAKVASKYDLLKPDAHHAAICQPFMGSAARSLGSPLPSYLGDINAAHRSIAGAYKFRAEFCAAYSAARDRLIEGIDRKLLARYKNQKPLKADYPDVFQLIIDRWHKMRAELFTDLKVESPDLAGRYYFALKSSFGQVMRLNPTETGFNSAWHIDKLNEAIEFSPMQWCLRMAITPFDAEIYPDWQRAIVAPPDPENTLLILDPPYWVDGSVHKMTSCYPGHAINYTGQIDPVFDLAIDPLKQAITLGYRTIYLCNYFSPQMEQAIADLTNGYSVIRHDMGECRALGNSNGRLIHGQRKDGRDRPVEAIWEIRFSGGSNSSLPKSSESASIFASESSFGRSIPQPPENEICTHIEAAIAACSLEVDRLRSEGVAPPNAWIDAEGKGDRTYWRRRWEEGNRKRSKALRQSELTEFRQQIDRRNRVQFLEIRIAELHEIIQKVEKFDRA